MSTPLTDKDASSIKAMSDEYIRLCLTQEWDKWKELLDEDIVFLPPDQQIVEGKKAVRAWIEDFPTMKEAASTVLQVDGRDDLAWGRGMFSMTIEAEPGALVSVKGKWTAHYLKQQDGSWLYESLIWNLDEPAS